MHQTNPKINSAANSVVVATSLLLLVLDYKFSYSILRQLCLERQFDGTSKVPKGLRCINGILLSDILDSMESLCIAGN